MNFSFELEWEKNEKKQKEAGIGPFKKHKLLMFFVGMPYNWSFYHP